MYSHFSGVGAELSRPVIDEDLHADVDRELEADVGPSSRATFRNIPSWRCGSAPISPSGGAACGTGRSGQRAYSAAA